MPNILVNSITTNSVSGVCFCSKIRLFGLKYSDNAILFLNNLYLHAIYLLCDIVYAEMPFEIWYPCPSNFINQIVRIPRDGFRTTKIILYVYRPTLTGRTPCFMFFYDWWWREISLRQKADIRAWMEGRDMWTNDYVLRNLTRVLWSISSSASFS
jgi:hypothetical protein